MRYLPDLRSKECYVCLDFPQAFLGIQKTDWAEHLKAIKHLEVIRYSSRGYNTLRHRSILERATRAQHQGKSWAHHRGLFWMPTTSYKHKLGAIVTVRAALMPLEPRFLGIRHSRVAQKLARLTWEPLPSAGPPVERLTGITLEPKRKPTRSYQAPKPGVTRYTLPPCGRVGCVGMCSCLFRTEFLGGQPMLDAP